MFRISNKEKFSGNPDNNTQYQTKIFQNENFLFQARAQQQQQRQQQQKIQYDIEENY